MTASAPPAAFTAEATDGTTAARTGTLRLARGTVRTPAFMPVGTLASVKGIAPDELRAIGAEIVLANTYHLMLRPGEALVRDFGGVSRFMAWDGPVLTDSGGYQIFSLADRREITPDGARFRSHIDGSEHLLSPERAVEIQAALGSDILMALDVCPPADADHAAVAESLEITHAWAVRCAERKRALEAEEAAAGEPAADAPAGRIPVRAQALFPIVQGGVHADLRRRSVEALLPLDAPGYAIGGVSVGEGPEAMRAVVHATAPLLPADRPRYLMGVGHPRDLLMAVEAGVDLFDCVLPTRNGRNGQAFTPDGRINLRNAVHRESRLPIDPDCDCPACTQFTRGYLRHLFLSGEMLASRLTSLHNLRFLLRLMEAARAAIRDGRLAAFAAETTARYLAGAGG
ncbi:MAG: tRNA guanosine(34) transglycosylase Tgt [Planctomycetota bacterium]